ncbi:MAG: peptidoglycan DD-metalloendopeptidase family protein [Bacteroidota bacterium]
MISEIALVLERHKTNFHPVVAFEPGKHKLLPLDFTEHNADLRQIDLSDTSQFSSYVEKELKSSHSTYGIGGYRENRVLYKRSNLFDTVSVEGRTIPPVGISPTTGRSIHLGIDIWGPAGTEVFMPLGGMVHSFAYNSNFGDYGATIIMQHQLDTISFHTLYGHVRLADLAPLSEGRYFTRGEVIAHFGAPNENGDWPPHLHFQVIQDMDLKAGDYPGVCSLDETAHYFANCPNPDLILNMMKYVKAEKVKA